MPTRPFPDHSPEPESVNFDGFWAGNREVVFAKKMNSQQTAGRVDIMDSNESPKEPRHLHNEVQGTKAQLREHLDHYTPGNEHGNLKRAL